MFHYNMSKKEDFKKKIDERITTSFSVTYIPVKDFRRFKELAKEEFRDNYAMTLKFLMDRWGTYQKLTEQIHALWKEINKLKEQEIKSEQKPTTFDD